MEYVSLNNGVKMPKLGYGVYQTPPEETEECVYNALIAAGYRSIDTAQAYGNEAGVGAAVKRSGIPREEIFITTKIWISNAGYEKAKASIEESLKKLQTDYIDLLNPPAFRRLLWKLSCNGRSIQSWKGKSDRSI